jgi:hypothetical protein
MCCGEIVFDLLALQHDLIGSTAQYSASPSFPPFLWYHEAPTISTLPPRYAFVMFAHDLVLASFLVDIRLPPHGAARIYQ